MNVSGLPASALPHSIRKLKEEWRAEWQKEWEAKHMGRATEEETNATLLQRLKVLHKRNEHAQFFPYLNDHKKRAAVDLLYGPKDWDLIQAKANATEEAHQL